MGARAAEYECSDRLSAAWLPMVAAEGPNGLMITSLEACPRCGTRLRLTRARRPAPSLRPAPPPVLDLRAGVPRRTPPAGTAPRPERRLGAQDPARPRRHLPARRRRDLPGRRLVLARHRRPHRGPRRAHRRHRCWPASGWPAGTSGSPPRRSPPSPLGLLCMDLFGARTPAGSGRLTGRAASSALLGGTLLAASVGALPARATAVRPPARRAGRARCSSSPAWPVTPHHVQVVATVTTLGLRRRWPSSAVGCASSCCPGSPSPGRSSPSSPRP